MYELAKCLQQPHEVGINTGLIYPCLPDLPGKEKLRHMAEVTQFISDRNLPSGRREYSVLFCRPEDRAEFCACPDTVVPREGLSEQLLCDSGQVWDQTTISLNIYNVEGTELDGVGLCLLSFAFLV